MQEKKAFIVFVSLAVAAVLLLSALQPSATGLFTAFSPFDAGKQGSSASPIVSVKPLAQATSIPLSSSHATVVPVANQEEPNSELTLGNPFPSPSPFAPNSSSGAFSPYAYTTSGGGQQPPVTSPQDLAALAAFDSKLAQAKIGEELKAAVLHNFSYFLMMT